MNYGTTCKNLETAWGIVTHPDATAGQKAVAGGYIAVEGAAHLCVALCVPSAAAAEYVMVAGTAACADGDCTNEAQRAGETARNLAADGDPKNEVQNAVNTAQRTINFLNNQSNRVHHIMQPKHAWDRVTNLSGNKVQDYQAIQPYLQQVVDNGTRELIVNPKSNATIVEYVYTIQGNTIVVRGIELANNVFQISDAWVQTGS